MHFQPEIETVELVFTARRVSANPAMTPKTTSPVMTKTRQVPSGHVTTPKGSKNLAGGEGCRGDRNHRIPCFAETSTPAGAQEERHTRAAHQRYRSSYFIKPSCNIATYSSWKVAPR